MPLRRLSALAFLCLLVLPAPGQDRLLSPADFLGYEPGTRFTPHHRVVAYFEHVAAASPNVRLEYYGETYEGRPLLVAYVARPDYLARLDAIRTNNLRLAGLAEGAVDGPTAALVWLSYNVHGNEAVSTEAALLTLYDLANPDDARTQAWLDSTVVIIDPCINPDGRDRYVHWYNQTVGRFPDPNPDAREHHEPWPGGRTNHYYFDLNRDWAWATQQETRHRLPLYQRWLPHVHVDFHEQGVDEPYYFAPAAEPFHDAITPWQRELQTIIGQNHARYFDERGWLYFTRQVFDLFYPGYGDTWPTFNGAVGMTYEQGGSGRAGLAIRTAEGDTLTLAERIAHHHTTGLSTVEATARHRTRVLAAFRDYYVQARTRPQGPYAAYVVRPGDAPDRLAALAAHLDAQGIAYGYATREHRRRGFNYATGQTGPVTVRPGDLVVSAYQPRGVLARVLLEPRPALADSLTYDVTAWALPYAYGLPAFALTERLEPDTATPPAPPPAPAALERPYAYLLPWKSFADAQFLAEVLRAGVRARYAMRPFEIDGRAYDPGTLILTRRGNEALGDRFDDTVREAARTHGRVLHPVATGFVARGPDFGSEDVAYLEPPRVAVLAGAGLSPGAVGEVWHFFDRQLGYPVTLIDPDDFAGIDLDDYDVLILPSGTYTEVLPESRLADLRAWIRRGGRLIALERAAAFFAGKDSFTLRQKKREEGENTEPADTTRRRFADRERAALSDDVPGAIFRVTLDPTHPLAFGYDTTYYSLKRGAEAYTLFKQGDGWNVGRLEADAHVTGFAGYRARRRLRDTLVFGVQPLGRGQVVYLIDDPLFRAFWYGGKLLFANAVFMVR
ncbi:zinc carboxypeptidase [Rhodocaloribacter litoris]|uniref:M14 family metallopeptidase n=1 Tax=Rhodocaloribacter litoris TaxID=2558931 RepID=UPI001421463F|nr:M14 family metallopeptidase [Rhodocaloribacter litoris]QXD16907.1 zinc carboxypeptidase [Rhodocaloribacter litoris]